MLSIRCSNLFTPTRLIKDAVILIDGRKILACGPASEMGKAPAGADADLALLDSNSRVAATLVGGEILFNTL